ncbi:sialidase family protein [uncultured Microbacterium sp.]|uniref:sialidase family protein n=1 Tax=uncultured Microbacterium sp. TaxID=191216 RepID=UPI002632BBD1|nr:sialidase family protein [uncultured Microbacterium sp.]
MRSDVVVKPGSDPRFERVLARRGEGGYRQFRIPALAISPRGTLLAAYDGRPNLDDLPNPIDLLLRRSFDGGRTWAAQQVVRTGTGLDGYGDPSILIDRETGRIFVFHAAGTHAGFFEAVEGIDDEDAVQHADVSYSDDDGETWTHRRLTGMLKRPGITGLFAAAGAGIQLHAGAFAGRLVQQFVVLHRGEIMAASAYSDDHGETWTLGELIAGTNENKVVCLSDGTVLMHSRATPHRLVALSRDGGHSYSIPAPHADLPDPSDNGSVARFDGLPNVDLARDDSDQWLLATHNHDTDLRRNTVLKLSQDDGVTWPFAVTLCGGSSAYSTVARLPDGRIGVLYERDGYQEIVFVSLPVDELLASPTAELTHDDGTVRTGEVEMDVVLRSITPARPAEWRSVGESVVLGVTEGDWDASAWKEVGQGYTADAPQVLSNRESQDLNYGPIAPGFRTGDLLAFSGRVRGQADAVTVSVAGQELLPATALAAGEKATFTHTHVVTADEVARGAVEIAFVMTVAGVGEARRVLAYDVRTGQALSY